MKQQRKYLVTILLKQDRPWYTESIIMAWDRDHAIGIGMNWARFRYGPVSPLVVQEYVNRSFNHLMREVEATIMDTVDNRIFELEQERLGLNFEF